MARLLKTWVADPSVCAYLPHQHSSMEYRLMVDVDPDELDKLLERGWRRFGPAYFRPKCRGCRECVPLRVPVADFKSSKQQRRCWNKRDRFSTELGTPQIDDERIELYDLWHADRAERRGWDGDRIDAVQYYHQFAFPHLSIRELSFRDAETSRLVAVAIVDETPRAFSAVYTFHHPDYRAYSLGTLAILEQIECARRSNKPMVYLGYRVRDCASSVYKAKFRPHELMVRWSEMDEPPEWRRL
ncbi:MAG: arginyltransferase [Myxococcota bacterium]